MENIIIGEANIKIRQILLLAISFVLIALNFVFFWISRSAETITLTVLTTLMLFMMNLCSSMVFEVSISGNSIHLDNLFRQKEFSLQEFESISITFPYSTVYKINLKGGAKYYFTISAKEALKMLFSINHSAYAVKLSDEVKKTIELKNICK